MMMVRLDTLNNDILNIISDWLEDFEVAEYPNFTQIHNLKERIVKYIVDHPNTIEKLDDDFKYMDDEALDEFMRDWLDDVADSSIVDEKDDSNNMTWEEYDNARKVRGQLPYENETLDESNECEKESEHDFNNLYIVDTEASVNHPNHYNQGEIECIEAIQGMLSKEEFDGFLRGNILKYLWRYKEKNGIEDLDKLNWYLEYLRK